MFFQLSTHDTTHALIFKFWTKVMQNLWWSVLLSRDGTVKYLF